MSAKIKAFKEKYPHIWVVSYFIIYMIWFVWLESRADEPYHVIHFPLDDYIPFCEYFIIPYLLWFAYAGTESKKVDRPTFTHPVRVHHPVHYVYQAAFLH